MDRTSWIGAIACFFLLLGWEYYSAAKWPPHLASHPVKGNEIVASAPAENPPQQNLTAGKTMPNEATSPAIAPANETFSTLENDDVKVTLTNFGGAIQKVELKKHIREGTEKIILNGNAAEGILDLTGWSGDEKSIPYTVQMSDGAVSYEHRFPNGVLLRREYRLAGDYQIEMTQRATNTAREKVQLPDYHLNVGTMGPIHIHDNPTYVGAGWYQPEEGLFRKISAMNFNASSFLGFQFREARSEIISDVSPLRWVTIKNQFFTLILAAPEKSLFLKAASYPVILPAWTKTTFLPHGIKTSVTEPGFELAPGASVTQSFHLYAGPKEYARLKKLGHHEDLAMDFGMFGWIVKPLLWFMRGIHSIIPSWGLSIIVMTLIIKTVLWPMQTVANKSMKQMQALQPRMEQLRTKYKDDPNKLNTEMINLYREFGVNPVGGCLPLLVQMPIFIGFYVMLQNVVELRGASFLWIHDLTQPDTVMHIGVYDLNLLPILMTVTSFLVMRMTPQAGDNQQMKIMQFMPLVLMVMLYNFAAALALYWTINNLISMGQTYINLRRPVPTLKRLPKKKTMMAG